MERCILRLITEPTGKADRETWRVHTYMCTITILTRIPSQLELNLMLARRSQVDSITFNDNSEIAARSVGQISK